uniref:(3R)-3-hydroxyacyl-CoA dehydrogenase n=1 Tax=Acrobeloides nanus TaxID=290746 RepID=A0A914E7V0_9BILA
MAGLVRGKLGIVTGGGSGLGRAICQRLAENGASLVVVDLRKETAQETVDLLSKASKEGQHYAFACDVGKREQIENLKSFFVEKFKKSPDLVVNNAGITKDTWLLKMTDEQFDDVINVNLKAVYMMTQTFARLAVEQQRSQSVVNLSSIVGKTGNIGQTNYAASKAGVLGFTKAAAKELARYNIRVNALLPGFIKTPMTSQIPDKVIAKITERIPIGKMGEAEDIGNVVTFLCSDLSKYMTGAQIEVTGGLDM